MNIELQIERLYVCVPGEGAEVPGRGSLEVARICFETSARSFEATSAADASAMFLSLPLEFFNLNLIIL